MSISFLLDFDKKLVSGSVIQNFMYPIQEGQLITNPSNQADPDPGHRFEQMNINIFAVLGDDESFPDRQHILRRAAKRALGLRVQGRPSRLQARHKEPGHL